MDLRISPLKNNISGKFPMSMRIRPLKIKKYGILVRRLAVDWRKATRHVATLRAIESSAVLHSVVRKDSLPYQTERDAPILAIQF